MWNQNYVLIVYNQFKKKTRNFETFDVENEKQIVF